MKLIFLLIVALGFSSCATYKAKQTGDLLKSPGNLPRQTQLSIPFVKQSDYYCGPASLSMIMKNLNYAGEMNELAKQMYTPKQKGSLKSDLASTTRRQGLMGIQLSNLDSILKELANKNPVLVFQNMGLSWYPAWHYAVATGYDLDNRTITLHTGKYQYKEVNLGEFERSWDLGGKWSMVILPPGKISVSADELSHVIAAAGLEQTGKIKEAELSYISIIEQWEYSFGALIGLGNITYARNDYTASIKYLTQATKHHPESAIAWHNLATAQGAAKLDFQAKESTKKALDLVSESQKSTFKESLKSWL